MMKVYNYFMLEYSFLRSLFWLNQLKKGCVLFTSACLFIGLNVLGQTNNYFGVSGNLSSSVWSTNPAGPYTSPLNTTGGAIINFDNAATVTGASINVVGINATANVTSWAGAGTLGTGGTVITINVIGGVTLNMFSQAVSAAAGTGFIKSGAGILALSTGSLYQAGFTLNNGTIVVGGVNSMGSNTLLLNGGIVASNSTTTTDLSGKYPGGITFGGDVQFGDIILPSLGSANINFTNNISLGAINRSLTLGGSGTITLGGSISGTGGLSFIANSNGTGIFDITNPTNTFTSSVNINGGQTRFAADGSFGNSANTIVIDGGQLLNGTSFTIGNTHPFQIGTSAATGINVASGTLTIDAVIADKTSSGSFTKYGIGKLLLTNASTYSGTTTIAASGGTLQLNKPGGNTLPATNNVVVNGGILQISTNQTLNNLSLVNGNLLVDDNVTLTINGTFDYFQAASITLGTGSIIAYGPTGTLKYSGTSATTATTLEFPSINGPNTVNINNSGGVTLPFNRIITGSLILSIGTFTIGANVLLDLDGASLSYTGGFISGTGIDNSTSDLTVKGTTGGTVILPTGVNIGLRNITVGGTRTLALNGINDLVLSGNLSIAGGATFDNGGESQVTDGGTPVIDISGTFITRDIDGFNGPNTSISNSINPTLNGGCTIEYGLAGNQVVNARPDYRNITFSGSGNKTLSSTFNPTGTVLITGNAIVNAANHTFGDINTNLTMNGGRLILSGTNNPQPHMSGSYNLTGGVIEFACNSASGQTIRNSAYREIEVSGSFVGNSNGNITLNSGGKFTVKTGGVFTINDNTITGPAGSQTVTVESGGEFKCGNNEGFYGFFPTASNNSSLHPDIETITLLTGSTVNYSRSTPLQVSGNQVISGTMPYQHLTLSGNGNKIAPISNLEIKGDFTVAGTASFVHNSGTVTMNGTGNQSFAGVTYNNLHLDNTGTKTLFGNASILDSIRIGNLISNPATILELGNNDLTLKSTVSKTARTGIMAPAVAINYNGTGRFIVERFYPADRSWRLITSPLSADNTPATIFSQWQNNGIYTPGIGAFVTGQNPNQGTNGLDYSGFDNYSLKKYETNALVNVANTLTPLSKGLAASADNVGYFMFVRGDRNRTPDNTIFPNTNTTTLSSRGKLQFGTQTFAGYTRTVAGRFYALIGNPYPSPIDLNKLTRLNIVKRFYVWDPNILDVGAYVTLEDLDNDGFYLITPPSPGGQDKYIQSSQAFYVETDAAMGASSISFEDSSKSQVNNLAMFRPLKPLSSTASFKSSLYRLNQDNSIKLADGNLAEFDDQFNGKVDLLDALKFTNMNETFGLARDKTFLTVERRPVISNDDTLFFNLTRTTPRNYQFRFEPNNLDPLLIAFLEDSYTGTRTPLSVTSTGTYDFTVNDIVASAANNRFQIVFKLTSTGPLPVTFNKIKAWPQGANIVVEWTVENEINIIKYEVEKSIDGVSFNKEHTTSATGANPGSTSYTWLDTKPVSGYNYYRIRSIDLDGKVQYSPIEKVSINKITPGITIYPNPVTDGIIRIQFNNSPAGLYHVKLINNIGQTILIKTIKHDGGTATETLVPAYKLGSGIYQMQLIAPGKEISLVKVIIK